MGAHESMEHAEHAEHASSSNKRIALLIAVIALFLALSETLGKSAQTDALSQNIEASNLWAFFQAKTVRMTTVRTAAENMQTQLEKENDASFKTVAGKRIDSWQKTAQRYDDEPETNEGRKQLVARAKKAEEKRDTALAKYHHFEVASAAFQIGIVLASATIITGMALLSWGAIALAAIGVGFTAIGLFAPHAVHLF
jgi:ABC-type multidrug transport system fused ATPase/permease subunit